MITKESVRFIFIVVVAEIIRKDIVTESATQFASYEILGQTDKFFA